MGPTWRHSLFNSSRITRIGPHAAEKSVSVINAQDMERDKRESLIANFRPKTDTSETKEDATSMKSENVKPTPKTWKEKFTYMKSNITVEPIMAFYIMPSVLASLATQNLNLEKACRVNLNYNDTVCDALSARETENYAFEESEVQKLIASVTAWKNAVQTAIPCFLILFVGAWSDKTGRRKVFILAPIVGEFLTCVGFIANTYFFYELPVEVAAITESIFPAMLGGWFTMFLGTFSYIADITTKEERTFRVGIVNLFMSLGIPVGTALSGILLRLIGYYGIFSVSAILYVISFTYGCITLKDPERSLKKRQDETFGCCEFLKSFFDVKLLAETFRVAFKKGQHNRRTRVILLLICVCVIFGPMHGEFQVMYLFTRYRFNWSEMEFSYFNTYSLITNLIGTTFSMTVFSSKLKLDDTILGIISLMSKILASFIYGFARNNFEIYMAPLVEILNATSFIALRSIASKLVSSEELGKINSLIAMAEATMPLVYGPMYSRFYMMTLTILPGAVFLLGAALTAPAVFIFAYLYFENKKASRKSETQKVLESFAAKTTSKINMAAMAGETPDGCLLQNNNTSLVK